MNIIRIILALFLPPVAAFLTVVSACISG